MKSERRCLPIVAKAQCGDIIKLRCLPHKCFYIGSDSRQQRLGRTTAVGIQNGGESRFAVKLTGSVRCLGDTVGINKQCIPGRKFQTA